MALNNNDTLFTYSFSEYNFRQLIFRSYSRNGNLLDSTSYIWDTSVYTVAIRPNSIDTMHSGAIVSVHDIFYQKWHYLYISF